MIIECIIWFVGLWLSVVASFMAPALWGKNKISTFFAFVIFTCGIILFEVLILACPY